MNFEPTFTSKTSTAANIIYKATPILANNITIISILFTISLIGIVLATDKNKIRLVFEAILSNRSMNQSFNDKTTFVSKSTILLFTNYVLCFSMLVFAANNTFTFISWNSSKLILTFSGFIIVLCMFKRGSMLLCGKLSGLKNEVQEYLFNHTIFTLAAGVLLIPLLIVLNFIDVDRGIVIQSAFVFLLLFMALRLVKSAAIAIRHNVGGLFYLFLYICTFEILPLIFLYKAFPSKIG
ncbi:MAG: DUF4271 domain-containing protein [Flavobacteriales bacterium]|nr:DUF4271 domain-containing protein [Flavobacteriales bacterium]MBT6745239.1 DUF4271 domain-containing protein [Flavobacteriales bacterium]